MQSDLSCFFRPKSIAIIGVSRNSTKAGYGILKNVLLTFPKTENIYPINPKAKEIMGVKVFPSILEIPGSIDLVICFVTPKIIPSLLHEFHRKGVRGVIIESAGFAEAGVKENLFKTK